MSKNLFYFLGEGLISNLHGKFGQIRHNILGRRVDFSARSVITVEPMLKLDECAISYSIDVNIFILLYRIILTVLLYFYILYN